MSFIDKLKGMFGPKHAHHPSEHTEENCDCELDPGAKEVCVCGEGECKGEECEVKQDCDCGPDHA